MINSEKTKSQGLQEKVGTVTLPDLISSQSKLNYKLSNIEQNINYIFSKLTRDRQYSDPDNNEEEEGIKSYNEIGLVNDLQERIDSAHYRTDDIKSIIQLIKNLL